MKFWVGWGKREGVSNNQRRVVCLKSIPDYRSANTFSCAKTVYLPVYEIRVLIRISSEDFTVYVVYMYLEGARRVCWNGCLPIDTLAVVIQHLSLRINALTGWPGLMSGLGGLPGWPRGICCQGSDPIRGRGAIRGRGPLAPITSVLWGTWGEGPLGREPNWDCPP